MKVFQPKLFSSFKNYNGHKLVSDIIAGIIVAIIALPLSIALAIASGASPAQGLYTAIVAGFVIAFLGGSNVNISGPTAAFATIVAGIIASNGFEGLVLATVMAGIILIILGVCHAGNLIRFIPHTITVGFTSGVAVTILIGQIKDFLGLDFGGAKPVEAAEKVVEIVKNFGTVSWKALVVGLVGLVILVAWNILGQRTKGVVKAIFTKIPGSIVAVVVGILVVCFTPLKTATIGSLYPDLEAGLPTFSLPSFKLDTVIAVIPDAFTIAILAAIESLLSCVVSDKMIGDKHNSNTELIAQGAGNICSGLFGGIPATGAIARTAANVKNGGRTPIAGIVHAVVLLLFLLVLMPVAKLIPMPIIAAILFLVAYNMSEWREFLHICKTGKAGDIIVLVVTFALTVVFNLVIAIVVGIILAVIFHLIGKLGSKKHTAEE
ncbi:MAG: sodium-independent anion transporter [Clostridia bacterium]|nr:sodium-independent anion transporter [Clostridia bacterium]